MQTYLKNHIISKNVMIKIEKNIRIILLGLMVLIIVSCGPSVNKNNNESNRSGMNDKPGTYGYDIEFLRNHEIDIIELSLNEGNSRIALSPSYQGRVMTSSANGNQGISFGWINHPLIESGDVSQQFNPVGGEERFWLGPEGGPFSIYFEQGREQVYENWKVPPVIDTEPFDVVSVDSISATFNKDAVLNNASGSTFKLNIKRKVQILSADELSEFLKVDIPADALDIVAYRSDNTITNNGAEAWTRDGGLLSIWLLCMFAPSPSTTVFIPYNPDAEGPVVNDEYFGKVPSDRLIIDEGIVYFKIDGKHRSKIGLPPQRATELCGSYDSAAKVLTLVWGALPSGDHLYVNSKWGEQVDPYDGDVINAYNDGPVDDGSIMGPFYEIETSSPGAELLPGTSLSHTQVIAHVQGDEGELERLVEQVFNLELKTISAKFN